MTVDSTLSSDGKNLTINISGRFDFEVVQEFRSAYTEHSDVDYVIDMLSLIHI